MLFGQRQVAPGAPYRTALQREADGLAGNIDDHPVRALLRVVFEHLLQAPAEVPGVALRGPLQQQVDGAQPDRTVARGNLGERQQRLQGLLVAPQQRQAVGLVQTPRLADVVPLRSLDLLLHLADQGQRLFRAPQVQQDRHAHLQEAVEYLLAGGEDLLLLFGQEGQGIFAAPVVEQRLGLLVAQAVEAGPGRVDPRQGLVAHLDALLHPARAVDVGVARRQVLGHAD